MGRYVARRLLQLVLVLLGATLILFCCLFVLPGDPVGSLGGDRVRDPAVVEELRERYGLDDPLVVQYGNYLWRTVQGDLGEDYTQRRPVSEVLAPKFVNSAKLAIVAIVFDIVLGVSAGILAALRRFSLTDVLVTIATTCAIGFPVFVIGLLLQNLFAVKLGWLPLFGMEDGFASYILPAMTLALVDAALVARLMRSTLLETLRADYVRTATAKGIARSRESSDTSCATP